MTPKRKAMEKKILTFMTKQDPSGYNTESMKAFFATLTDTAFVKWAEALRDGKTKIPVYQIPFKNNIQPKSSLEAAKFLGLEPFQRIRMWDSVTKRFVMTPHKYLVLRLPVRRLKQHRDDGISVPRSDKRLNPLTDQVVQPDKGSAISFPQLQVLVSHGLLKTSDEFFSVRGGDLGAYNQYKASLEETGRVSLSEITDSTGVKSAEVLRTLLMAMHLDNNL